MLAYRPKELLHPGVDPEWIPSKICAFDWARKSCAVQIGSSAISLESQVPF